MHEECDWCDIGKSRLMKLALEAAESRNRRERTKRDPKGSVVSQ